MNPVTLETISEVEQLLQDGISRTEIGRLVGHGFSTIRQIADGQHELQINGESLTGVQARRKSREAVSAIVGERSKQGLGAGKMFMPTPLQIQTACQAIRDTWSETENYNRRSGTLDKDFD